MVNYINNWINDLLKEADELEAYISTLSEGDFYFNFHCQELESIYKKIDELLEEIADDDEAVG